MAITFRHDAAGVVPPSNSSTRKYGQSLVMQQQQQKYAAQQAGYDRMFDAYKMENQNQFQQQRDWQQRDFVLNRDRDQAKLQQQQMDAARQQQFMDEARKASSAMIMDDIQQGNYDPATARKLQQNLVAESEALGNPQLDATQRAEALQKIRAERALLSANRMEKPPAPTAQDQFDQQIVTRNGVDYVQNPRGGWEPLQQPKPSKEELQQQQQAEQMRPMSAQEYYGQNEDKFQKDLDSTMNAMQKEYELDPSKPKPTPEAAWEQMQRNHDFKQKALGRSQYGEPTVAPAQPGAAPAGQPGEMRSILEQQPDMSQMENPISSSYATPSAPQIPTNEYDAAVAANGTGRMPYDVPQRGSQAPVQSDWDALASGQGLVDMGPAGQPPLVQKTMPPTTRASKRPQPNAGQSTAPVAPPDFNALASQADGVNKQAITALQGIYQSQTPDVQTAIGVLLDPKAPNADAAKALAYLQSKGIDMKSLTTSKPSTTYRALNSGGR